MKSSTQVFTSLVVALAMFSQPAIATYIYADRQVNINSDAISAGTKNRKNLLECSQAKPCINDRIVIDSYKEVFSESGKLQEAKIVLYNTSFAPVAIEVFSYDGKFKSVEFVDGAKAGFKDLGDFLKTASAGLIGPFQCTTNWFECLGDSRYGIEKNERTIKLQAGDVIRISRGSDAAFAYTIASSNIGLLELLTSIPGITPSKVTSPSLLKNYSPELKRRIIQGFIIQKMNEKYTWKMIFEQLGYEAYKKSASNPQDLLNNTLEIVQNVPQDFWKNMTDGTVAATAAGDVVDTLVQAVSSKASIALNSSLFISQSVNIRATYTASEVAHNKPYLIVVAGLKDSNQPVATKPNTRSPKIPTTVYSLNPQLASILPALKQNTKMTILLPSNLSSKGIAFCPTFQQDRYSIGLYGGEDCRSQSQANYMGYISGEGGHQTLKVNEDDQKVKLSKGILGYYYPRGYRVPPGIRWIYKGILYSMQLREDINGKNRNPSQAKAFVISVANSAIQAGSR